MSDVKRLKENTKYFFLDVSKDDALMVNQISEELAKKVGRIEQFGPSVQFQAFNHSSKREQVVADSPSPAAMRYTIPHVANVGINLSFPIHDPFLDIEVRCGLATFQNVDGVYKAVMKPHLEELKFKKERNGIITLYANNLKHQKYFQLLMLHPENKDNIVRTIKIDENHGTGLHVGEHKFRFHMVETEEQRELREERDNKLRKRVLDALEQAYEQKATHVLRTLYTSQAVNPGADVEGAKQLSARSIYNALVTIAHKKADSIHMVLATPEIVRWRNAYAMFGNEFKFNNHILSYNGKTIAHDLVNDEEAVREVYAYITNNPDVKSESLLTPNVETEPLFAESQTAKRGRSRNAIGSTQE